MTILNNQIYEVAKSINGESHVAPTHLGFTEDELDINISDTTLPNEIGSRNTLSGSRSLNTIEFSALRLSTDVVDTVNGDDIKGIGTFDAVTSGTMLIENDVIGLLQTTNFDVEFIDTINIIQG